MENQYTVRLYFFVGGWGRKHKRTKIQGKFVRIFGANNQKFCGRISSAEYISSQSENALHNFYLVGANQTIFGGGDPQLSTRVLICNVFHLWTQNFEIISRLAGTTFYAESEYQAKNQPIRSQKLDIFSPGHRSDYYEIFGLSPNKGIPRSIFGQGSNKGTLTF